MHTLERLESAAMLHSSRPGVRSTVYTRDELLLARLLACRCQLPPTAVNNVSTLGLRRHRGTRAGCNKQRPIRTVDTRHRSRDCQMHRCMSDCKRKQMCTTLQSADTRPNRHVRLRAKKSVVTNRSVSARRPDPTRHRAQSSLLRVHVDRHGNSRGKDLTFASFNINSLTYKLEDLLDVRYEKRIDVMFLVETHHDIDSVSLRRLRADGFQVVDRSRPRLLTDTLAKN